MPCDGAPSEEEEERRKRKKPEERKRKRGSGSAEAEAPADLFASSHIHIVSKLAAAYVTHWCRIMFSQRLHATVWSQSLSVLHDLPQSSGFGTSP